MQLTQADAMGYDEAVKYHEARKKVIRALASPLPSEGVAEERCVECEHEAIFSDSGTTRCKKPVRTQAAKDKSTAETHAEDFEACGHRCTFTRVEQPQRKN